MNVKGEEKKRVLSSAATGLLDLPDEDPVQKQDCCFTYQSQIKSCFTHLLLNRWAKVMAAVYLQDERECEFFLNYFF